MEPLANKTIRAVITIVVMALCAATIAWLLTWGHPENSLHTSALSWSYSLIGFGLIVLLGEAALADYFTKRTQQ